MSTTLHLNWQAISPERSKLGESPFWHPHEQMLYWVDIPGRELLRCNVFTGHIEHWALPSEPGCVAPARAGGLVLALRDGVYRARDWGGTLQRIAGFSHDPRTTRFNDGRCDPQGRFWAGTIYEPRDRRLGELFSVDAREGGKPTLALRAINNVVSNGLAWSPDGRTLYWADTQDHRIDAWTFDPTSGALRRRHGRGLWRSPGWCRCRRRRQLLERPVRGRPPAQVLARGRVAGRGAAAGALPHHALLWGRRWPHPVCHHRVQWSPGGRGRTLAGQRPRAGSPGRCAGPAGEFLRRGLSAGLVTGHLGRCALSGPAGRKLPGLNFLHAGRSKKSRGVLSHLPGPGRTICAHGDRLANPHRAHSRRRRRCHAPAHPRGWHQGFLWPEPSRPGAGHPQPVGHQRLRTQ